MTSENSLSAPESHQQGSPGYPDTSEPAFVDGADADQARQAIQRDRRRTRRGTRGKGVGTADPTPEPGIPPAALDRLRHAYESRRS